MWSKMPLSFAKRRAVVNYISLSRSLAYTAVRSHWEKPVGYDTNIKVYHPHLREKVPLILKNQCLATWYMCGPTVYADAHIGHASCYIKFDIIRRIMEQIFNIDVVSVMGITDIDDKIIKKAQQMQCSVTTISRMYETEFFRDMEQLNVQSPSLVTRVTDFIPQIISFCEQLIEKDYAYVTSEGNVYFDVPKVTPEDVNEQLSSELHPVLDPLKKDPRDFALWKAAKPEEPFWLSPWGEGRPGWHIECSAMASHVFGSQMDIHSGGSDLQFPHHANEKSQSEAYHACQQWVNYWLHAGLLHVGQDVKMSKSLENTISIKDFLQANKGNVLRMLCLQSHYRNSMEYSAESVELVTNTCSKLHTFLNDVESYIAGDLFCPSFDEAELRKKFEDTKAKVLDLLADDFNTSSVVTCILDLLGETNRYLLQPCDTSVTSSIEIVSTIAAYIDKILDTVGVCIITRKKLPIVFVKIVNIVVDFRTKIRSNAIQCLSSKKRKEITRTSFRAHTHSTIASPLEDLKESLNDVTKLTEHTQKELSRINESFGAMESSSVSPTEYSHRSSLCLKNVMSEFTTFCTNVRSIADIDETTNVSNTLHPDAVDTLKRNSQMEREKSMKLLKLTDEFRNQLRHLGIGIKDLKATSVWFPLE